MRKTAVLLSFLVVLSAFGQASPDSLLERGTAAYRSGDYASAVTDLQAAAQGFLSPEKMQAYVNTGKFEHLDKFETALVYLALSQSKLGREADARETILRLMSAERISPTYGRLQIADAGEFDTLVTTLVPSASLSRGRTDVQIATATAAPATEGTAPTQVAQTQESRVATKRTIAEEKAERQRIIDEMVAIERERIQREADARIASEREASEKAAAERVAAAEREAAQRLAQVQSETQQQIAAAQTESQQKIAAAQTESQQRIAAVESESQQKIAAAQSESQQKIAAAEAESRQRIEAAQREAEQRIAALQKEAQERLTVAEADAAARVAAAQREAEQRVAAAQATAQKDAETRIAQIQQETEQRIAQERAVAERAAAAQIAEASAAARRAYLTSLRQAEAFSNTGDIDGANAIYVRLANSENVPREIVAEAAVGLYRTGAFKHAVNAFRRMGTFAKGEEDLRYYHAVALYETGSYQDAQKELSCALPFIQVTDDVSRYRVKIEQTAQQTALVR